MKRVESDEVNVTFQCLVDLGSAVVSASFFICFIKNLLKLLFIVMVFPFSLG